MKTAFATGDGKSFTNRHFGDNEYYYIYDISETESKFIKRINNNAATIEEKVHADPAKAKGVTGLLKEENVKVVVSKVYGPNIKRIRKNFVCIIMNNTISDSINIIMENFKDISDEWEKGEERKHLNLKQLKVGSRQSAKIQSIMKLEHIALTVSELVDIKDFYLDILGMKEMKNFVLDKSLANKIFNIDKEVSVYLLQKNDISLEIFILPEQKKQNFEHICFTFNNREELVENCLKQNYECIRIERDLFDLVFIKDKSGNIFEIKEEEKRK